MTTQTTTTTPEEAARALYAEEFGDKAAKRNAGRIARLAELIGQHGAGNVTLRTVYTDGRQQAAQLMESGAAILGHTSTSASRSTFVVADCHEQVSAPLYPLYPATERQADIVPTTTPPAPVSPAPSRPASRGQLWQDCYCGTEPVCAGCENCDRHCTCGAATAYVAGEIYGGEG